MKNDTVGTICAITEKAVEGKQVEKQDRVEKMDVDDDKEVLPEKKDDTVLPMELSPVKNKDSKDENKEEASNNVKTRSCGRIDILKNSAGSANALPPHRDVRSLIRYIVMGLGLWRSEQFWTSCFMHWR